MLAFLIFSPPRYNFNLFLPTKLVSVVIYFSLTDYTDYPKLILHWYACGADGRSLVRSVYGYMITKFSGMGTLPHFLSYGAPLLQRAALNCLVPWRVHRKNLLLKAQRGKIPLNSNK